MSEIFDNLLKQTDLYTRVRISLQMDDLQNWKDGEYLGDPELIERQTKAICKLVDEWQGDEAPMYPKSWEDEVDDLNQRGL